MAKKIYLTQIKYAIVDDEDYPWLSKYRWYYTRGYAVRVIADFNLLTGKKTTRVVFMHRMILEAPEGFFIDHINRNKLDNRKENLRIVTRSQNYRNKDRQRNNKSGYKGVSWYKKRGMWQAAIKPPGCPFEHLGYFVSKEDAARAYNRAAKLYQGEYAVLNDVPEKTLLSQAI